ncbi:MAG: sigma-70 family RNA polymerase sigma factor [Hymenobacter sp.]|nr:MAG: sigma-70 family RNA polymerase sigma factor [Hymenobacter sp.]
MPFITSDLLTAEADLVHRLQRRDQAAFEEFYKQYATALFSMILRVVKDDEKAEDILQDALMKIWHSVGSYTPDKGRFFTWVSNISRSLAINAIRTGNKSNFLNSPNSVAETLSSQINTIPTKLNSLQISLLRLFERGISDAEVLELRRVLVTHMSQKLLVEVERVNEERGYTAADVEAMLNDPS